MLKVKNGFPTGDPQHRSFTLVYLSNYLESKFKNELKLRQKYMPDNLLLAE